MPAKIWLALFHLSAAAALAGCATACPPSCAGKNWGPADLEQRNFSGANMVNIHARQASLRYSDLTFTDLSGADLTGANLANADLAGSLLLSANLVGADLSGANLENANLSSANVTEADFTGAHLLGASLIGSQMSAANLVGANLVNQNLAGAILDGAQLTGASMAGADLNGSILDKAAMRGADLRYTKLRGSWVNLADLVGVNAENADLSGTELIGTDLTGSNLHNANLEGVNLVGANLSGADLRGANLRSAIIHLPAAGFAPLLMADPLFWELSQRQWDNLNLADTVFNGAMYDRATIWPNGVLPASDLVFDPGKKTAGSQASPIQVINLVIPPFYQPLAEDLASKFSSKTRATLFKLVATSTFDDAFAARLGANPSVALWPIAANHSTNPANKTETIGYQMIAVVIHPANPLPSISASQLTSILAGQQPGWGPLTKGKFVQPISILWQPSVTTHLIADVLSEMNPNIDQATFIPSRSDGTVRGDLSGLQGGIAFVPAQLAGSGIKPLMVQPNANLENGIVIDAAGFGYPVGLITSQPNDPSIREFIAFALGEEGRQIISNAGLLPIPTTGQEP